MHGSLPTKLRVLRAERGLTLRDAERLTGVDKDTLSKIERGRRDPQDITLAKIAKGYGVPVEELLGEPAPLGEAPGEAGPPLLDKALAAARQDQEKTARAANRLFASEGVLPGINITEFEEDRFRAELRALGFPDEYFESFIWPLVVTAARVEQLEQALAACEEERRREMAHDR
jgi:transcriptional regulator with XRE-family HTH domain